MSKILIQLFVLSMISCALSFVYANESAVAKMKTIYLKGKLGSEKDQVGEKITNNYEVLPFSMAIDLKGNVYLADHVNDRIQKYDSQGVHLLTIKFDDKKEKLSLNVDDMAIDNKNNLIVVSASKRSIYKYDSNGKKLQTINYSETKIQWDDFRKDWRSGYIQVEHVKVDSRGNIYLQGFDELIKFDSKGNILAKWAPISYERGAVFVLDEDDNLYLMKEHGTIIEEYDPNGKILGQGKCGELSSWIRKKSCYLPQFIDKNGFIYWFEQISPTSTNMNMFAVKANSNRKVLQRIPFGFDPYGNAVKFDPQGNIYALNSSKTEFWIEKYSWDNNNSD